MHYIFVFDIFTSLQDVVKIENIKKIEKKIGYARGRGGSSKSCLKVKKNMPDNTIETYLKSKEEETPQLVMFLDEDNIDMICITGDGIVISVERKSVEYSLVVLAACYYVYDLAFPRKYELFLEFIKHCIFKDEDKKKKKTTGFIDLLHKMNE